MFHEAWRTALGRLGTSSASTTCSLTAPFRPSNKSTVGRAMSRFPWQVGWKARRLVSLPPIIASPRPHCDWIDKTRVTIDAGVATYHITSALPETDRRGLQRASLPSTCSASRRSGKEQHDSRTISRLRLPVRLALATLVSNGCQATSPARQARKQSAGVESPRTKGTGPCAYARNALSRPSRC
jgi:hypothetical protein